jgi:hypothetical protein
MIVEKQMECRLAGETEVLGENLPQRQSTRLTAFETCPSLNLENDTISPDISLCVLPEYIYVDASIVPSNKPSMVAHATKNLMDPKKNCNLLFFNHFCASFKQFDGVLFNIFFCTIMEYIYEFNSSCCF